MALGHYFKKFNYLVLEYYPLFTAVSIFVFPLAVYLDFCLKYIGGKEILLADYLYKIATNLNSNATIFMPIVAAIQVFFIVLEILAANYHKDSPCVLTEEDFKQQYSNFIFKKLMHDIDAIQKKYMANRSKIPLTHENYVRAREEMTRKIRKFNANVKKILCPTMEEACLPAHERYRVTEDEERELRNSQFFRIYVNVDEDFLRRLVNR